MREKWALAWSMLLIRIPFRSVGETAKLALLGAVAAAGALTIPQWNWYGFSPLFTILEIGDLIGGWLVLGVTLGLLRGRLERRTASS